MAKARKSGVFGVHPLLATAAAIVLVLFGALLGAWVDTETREPPAPPRTVKTASVPRPSAQPPPFLSLKSDSFERPDPVGPKTPQRPSAEGAAVPKPEPEPALPPAAYRVASTAAPTAYVVAIVIDDMGLDRVRSQRMIELPGPLTLSFLTYASGLQGWADRARAAGHEVMAHLPMEPLDPREDPGPGALTMAMTAEQLADRLQSMLSGWHGFIGVNNHMGSRMTADRWRMDLMMGHLKQRGLLWLDSKTAPDTAAMAAAAAAEVPHVERDFFLDNVATVDAVLAQLDAVAAHARGTGVAIAIGHPYDVTMVALETWITSLPARKLALVPVSEAARRRGQPLAVVAAAR
jgi:polysaccharide deacetylase 2 family uncharacterized protein YibQ